ncbi:NEDD8 ultimate buster 1 [Zootermopsis nevadensis]|uniref:NEDD8 ultimate buster 1 n=3 Tax=Zootermopsis nevadensis TaxID=136037 RepID=A0A067QKR7_ZOONE|nr:NEDD8 ultimate buster 1 [Zootermopsis nevadensis]
MNSDLKIEGIRIQIREKLNEDNVKLWLPPYCAEDGGTCEEEMQTLMKNYCSSLGIAADCCLAVLRELQQHSLDRLHERDYFKETGLATIRIRVPDKSHNRRIISLKTKLSAMVQEVQQTVASQIGVEFDRIKLIWSGKVLMMNTELATHGIQNGTQIMAVVLHSNPKEIKAVESRHREMEATLAAAKLLAGRSNDNSDYYLQVTDQSGKTLNLPPEERQALVIAMSLHEKGKVALKKEDYALALVLLLEADKEFSHCQSQLLQSVDNYAVLNLDIAWCYLCLRSVTHIPDAEQRLRKCEQNFHQSYGPNLERLLALKGTTGNEAALFMRLHLLQAIVLFHQNKRQEASKLLARADSELSSLKVDDHSLSTLIELGYTAAEARFGLRAAHGDLSTAEVYIAKQRADRAESKNKEKAERQLNRERRQLGRCIDGVQWVEPKLHRSLISMGYSSEVARVALQESNNNVSLSIQLIQDQPNLLNVASTSKFRVERDILQQVVAVGFDPRMAKIALQHHCGDVQKAVEELVTRGGIIDGEHCSDDSDDLEDHAHADVKEKTGAGMQPDTKQEDREKERLAYERLAEGMPTEEDDHLDLTLELEETFLREYQTLLINP